jgi:hypothetical protein
MNFYGPKKNKSSVPEWVHEYGAYIGLGVVVAFLFIGTKLVSFMRGPKAPVPVEHAELFIALGPVRTWQEESDTKIKSVEVKVRNVGTIVAEAVAVNGVVRQSVFPLPGKPVLAVGEIASYSAPVPFSVTATDQIDIQLSCATCAAFAPAP